MLRYELNVEDMADIYLAFQAGIDTLYPDKANDVQRYRLMDLCERFRNAHVVYIETEEGL